MSLLDFLKQNEYCSVCYLKLECRLVLTIEYDTTHNFYFKCDDYNNIKYPIIFSKKIDISDPQHICVDINNIIYINKKITSSSLHLECYRCNYKSCSAAGDFNRINNIYNYKIIECINYNNYIITNNNKSLASWLYNKSSNSIKLPFKDLKYWIKSTEKLEKIIKYHSLLV